MPSSSQIKIQKSIKELQEILGKCHFDCTNIVKQLQNLEITVNQQKLNLHIVSQNIILLQSVLDLINSNKTISNLYTITNDILLDIDDNLGQKSNKTLELSSCETHKNTKILQLEANVTKTIGRDPQCDISLDSQIYRGVSWHHAIIQPATNLEETDLWEVADLNSSNGTFINGKKLTKSQIIQPGDCITLAMDKPDEGIANFVFNVQNDQQNSQADNLEQEIFNHDIILLIINSPTELTKQEKILINKISQFQFIQLFLVVDLPKEQINIDEPFLDNCLFNNQNIELFLLYLYPYYHSNNNLNKEKCQQNLENSFFDKLIALSSEWDNILEIRIQQKIKKIINSIDSLFQEQEKESKVKIASLEKDLANISLVNYKELTQQAFSNFNDIKENFFKQIKQEINQSKSRVLAPFIQDSILFRVDNYIKNLKANIIRKKGFSYIAIQLNSNATDFQDIHGIISQFCFQLVKEWSEKEWVKINTVYGDGGFNEFITRAYKNFEIIPLPLNELFFTSPEFPNLERILQFSWAPIENKTIHKQQSFPGYIFKQIRSNLMQIMMMTTLMLTFMGFNTNRKQLIDKISQSFNAYPWLLGLVIFTIIWFLSQNYHREDYLEKQEKEQKLKKDLVSYYQNLVKDIIEQIIQIFNYSLEQESRKIQNDFVNLQKNYSEYILDIQAKQEEIKRQIHTETKKQENLQKIREQLKKEK